MHRFTSQLNIILVVFLLTSCGNPLPELKGVDIDKWKNDRNGCSGHRASMKEAISQEKEKLLALKEMEIISLLGRPDRNELYKRNQKFYQYFIDASADCGSGDTTQRLRLAIRFNAMGLAKEVAVE